MKKLIALIAIVSIGLFSIGCNKDTKLKILNWGDYIDEDLLEKYTEETGIEVEYNLATSNEEMYTQMMKTDYDIVIPSEYMISKLSKEEMISKIDFSKLENYDEDNLDEVAIKLLKESKINDYTVPYFFGTLGIMYNDNNEGLMNELESSNNVFETFFNSNSDSLGMYDSSRDSIASALISLNKDVNSKSDIDASVELLKNKEFKQWGEDQLKADVANGNLDAAVVYSGDYFDQLFKYESEDKEIDFKYITSNNSNIWIDGIVIPTTANEERSYSFIDFMLDEENAVINADYVGYCSPFTNIYDEMIEELEYVYEFYHPYKGKFNEMDEFLKDEEMFDPLNLQMYIYDKDLFDKLEDGYLTAKS